MRHIFIHKKPDTLRYAIFMIFLNWHIYIHKKHNTLRNVTFLHTKPQTLRKKQDNLRYVFSIQKSRHLALRNFYGILEIGGVGGGI